jgi:acyl transferase domain-containing protein/NADPH:quinone reductase-like Zn-dependent oxidoreductase/acyl carrier protein/NADP-dependent 3-hydroxy acid dehydrogenase YdfG
MAGLLKAMLVLESGRIPASLHCEQPNPRIPFADLNLALVPHEIDLAAPSVAGKSGPGKGAAHGRPMVGINSFGFGGTNAHAVLEMAPPPVARADLLLDQDAQRCALSGMGRERFAPRRSVPPLLLSARSDAALRDLALAWDAKLACADDPAALLRGAARFREQHKLRLALAGDGVAELRAGLAAFCGGRGASDVMSGAALGGGVAFVFSGNGSQWAGMAADALRHSAGFRAGLAAADAALRPWLGWSVAGRLAAIDEESLRDAAVAQPLLFAVQVASVLALEGLGVRPDACMGHSVGEVAAAWASGALDLDQAARVIAARSRHQHAARDGNGGMAVIGLGADAVADVLDGTGLEMAALNSDSATTIAGPVAALDALGEEAERQGWGYTRLDLDHAFHSAAMDPIRAPLLHDLAGLRPLPARVKFISTVTGAAMQGEELGAGYWWRNVREPVRFAQAARTLAAGGTTLFLEIGPQPILQGYLNSALRAEARAGKALCVLLRRPARRDPMLLAALACHVAGADIRDMAMFEGEGARDLPRYPWQREHFWVERSADLVDPVRSITEHPMLGVRRDAEPLEWSQEFGLALQPWLADHSAGGVAVVPAAAMIDMALAAAAARHPAAVVLEVLDLEINRSIVLEPGLIRDVRLRVLGPNGGFELASRRRLSGDAWSVCATGRLTSGDDVAPARPVITAGPPTRRVGPAALYELAARLGLDYGPCFRTVTAVDILGPTEAIVRLAPSRAGADQMISPPRLDGAFQGLVALAAGLLDGGSGVLPWRFGRVRMLRPAGTPFARARLSVTRVGPRSIRADVLVVDADDAPVAEFLDCWFVRVAFGAATDQGARMLASRLELSADTARPAPGRALIAAALDVPAADLAGGDDSGMLADAFASTAALRAMRALDARMADPARLEEVTGWLELDGLSLDDAVDESPTDADAILRTMLYEQPDAVADIALLARAAETLPALLRGAVPDAAPRPLLDQFLHDSPAGARTVAALLAAMERLARCWPASQPLRVLQIDARRGAFGTSLLARLRGVAELRLVAATSADDAGALADSLGDAASVIVWQPGEPADKLGRFDVVIGLYALSALGAGREALGGLRDLLAPGGMLLAAEPEPNRVWRLVLPQVWTLPGAAWAARLREAGFEAPAARALAPGLWPASLIAGQASADVTPLAASTGRIALFAGPEDALTQPLAAALREAGLAVEIRDLSLPDVFAPGGFESGMPALLIFPDDDGADLAVLLARLAALPLAVGEGEARITLLTRGAADGDAAAAALLGACRVLTNEAPNIAVRSIRLARDLGLAGAVRLAAREMLHPDGETEVIWTASGRRVPRLARVARAAAQAGTPTRLAITRPGLLDSLQWQAAAALPPGPGEVAIAVQAAGLNFRDVMWSMGLLPDEALLDGLTGPTLGLECAGLVTEVGEGVRGLAPGDRVMAFAPASLGSHAVTVAHAVLPIPPQMSFAAAATMPVAFLTAAYALGQLAQIEPGERVLIHGAAGGVGLAALQYARHRGAVVFATAGSDTKRALLRGLGADAVMDSRSLRFADDVMRLTGGEGVDVVLNSLSGEAMERSLAVLRPFGRFLELGKRDFYGNTPIGLRPFRQNISYFGIDADQLPTRRPKLAAKLFAEIAELLREGAIRPLPHRVMGFTEVVDAFRLMQSSGHIGKVVLTPAAMPDVAAPAPVFAARPDRTFVVTGGLDGFGLATAQWLVARGARHLALLSRRGPTSPGASDRVEAFAAEGVTAKVFACDVGDAGALDATLRTIRETMQPIGGVVHAAVAMDDALLFHLDEGRFARALRPKLAGADNLDRLTREDPIALFLLHSSITSTFGNPGQANYVAANAAMEAVAERRHREGLPALAVQWGPIGDAGYLTRETGVGALLERRLGHANLSARAALDAIPALLASGLPVVTYADINWRNLRPSLPLLAGPMFAALGVGEAEIAPLDLRELLATLPFDEAQEKVTELLVKEVARILKLSAERVDPRQPLSEFGMDSLMAVELRLAVEQRFGITIPVLALSEGATLAVLAQRVVRGLGDGRADGDAELRERIARFETEAAAEPAPAMPEMTGP